MLPSLWPTKLSNNNRNTFELQKKKDTEARKNYAISRFSKIRFQINMGYEI